MGRQLAVLNEKPRHLPGPELLHELIAWEASPHDVAIEYTDDRGSCQILTYERLRARSDALAARLIRARDAGRSRRTTRFIVPLYIQQCLELYVAQIAVLKSGGAFCPISLDVPEDRLRFILQDTDASVLVTAADHIDHLPHLEGINVLSIEDNETNDRPFAAPSIQASEAAYIMYTSGSTGIPKGVVISHSAVTQALLAHERHVPHFRRFLQFASPTFDVSCFEIFFPLYRGATLVACHRKQLLNDLPDVINRLKVDAAELTPSVASTLLRGRQSVPGLELLLTIGEMLKRSVVEEFAASTEQTGILCGMYGPTEVAIHCTVQSCFQKAMSVRDIGMPLDTVSAFVVRPAENDDGGIPEILTLGEEGELALGGTQLADGYLNREEQTRAAFVYHPQYGRLYRTGDRARIGDDGRLECLGRISSGQVKLRGQRIELGEIEYAASKTPACGSSVAEVVDGQLVVFCVRAETSLTSNGVKQTCGKWLPVFMVPTTVVLLDALPYLASGKLDRTALAALRTPEPRPAQRGVLDHPPNSRLACDIINTIKKICGVEADETTDLASVGVDSLSAIRIAAELRRLGHDRTDATVILDARHIQDLEESMNQSTSDTPTRDDVPISRLALNDEPLLAHVRDEIDYISPCTPVQSAMLSVIGRDPQAYCNSVTLDVEASATPEKVRTAIQGISQAHSMLRSGFIATAQSRTGYATIIWKNAAADRVKIVDRLDDSFGINNAIDLLRPSCFQVIARGNLVRVLLHIHHALYDQWSMDVLKRNLSASMNGRAIAHTASFELVSAHYTSKLEGSAKEKNEVFWQDQLRDCTATLLPNMNTKVVAPGLQRTQWHDLDLEIADARSKALRLGISLPAVFQSAMAIILGSYCGSADVTFGAVFSGRHLPLPAIEEVFGPCLVTLPCRVDTSTARTCADILRVLHAANRDMQRHTDLPLAEIIQAAGCAPGSKLFDTLFVWQETTLQTDHLDICVVEADSRDRHEFNLVLEFDPTDRLSVRATYQRALITDEQVDVLLRQLVLYASRMLEAPETLLADLHSCLDESLLSVSNPEPSYCADSHGLVAAFEHQATQQPDAIALLFATSIEKDGMTTDSLTFAGLNRQANQMAHFLRSVGIASGDLVCICMEKSLSLYASILAILKAGAGYVPLTPATPSARTRAIVQQAQVQYVLCDATSKEILVLMNGTTVLDVSDIDFHDLPSHDLRLAYVRDDIAYTVFTSGSTGEPKGVSVTHENLNGNLAALSDLYGVKSGDRLLQACSQAFDVSVFEIVFALTRGLCLCSASNATLLGDLELSIRSFGITHLSLTPTVAALIDPANVRTVRFLVTAGEGVTEFVRQRWAGKGLLHQGYGPSEITNICSINMQMSLDDSLGSIGPPLKNTSVFVLSPDHDFQILPLGSTGELAFGGEQVFRGYLGRDDLNSTKLLDHPRFGRIYKSGDTGRIHPDGSLLIAGRMDDQIKLRGNRIELGEINAAILSNRDVQDCTTLLCGETEPNKLLVAFWVPQAAQTRNRPDLTIYETDASKIGSLYEQLEEKLPAYMIPSVLLPVSHLPMTSQMKLDRRMLQRLISGVHTEIKLRYTRGNEVSDNDEEWTTEQSIIADAVAEIMQISRRTVGKSISFFALGMNSLNAIAAARQISDRLGRIVSISTFMRHASTKRLAAVMRAEAQSVSPHHDPSFKDTFSSAFRAQVHKEYADRGLAISAILPCTPLQDAMLSASEANTSSSYYNTTTYRISGDVEHLKECWQQLAARHAILRTSFVRTESSEHPYAQVVSQLTNRPCCYRLESDGNIGCKGLTFPQPPPELSLHQPFRIDSCGQVLIIHMHHALYDGVSMSVLEDELQQLYRGEHMTSAMPFEPYLAFAAQHSSATAMDAWTKRLAGYVPKPFPCIDRTGRHSSGLTRVSILSHSTADLDGFCKRYAVTPLSILQAAWTKVLNRTQDASDICFGNVVSGRSIPLPGVERLVAPCFNTVPVRINVVQHSSNIRLIQELHKQNVANFQYQLTPLRRLQTLSSQPQCHLFDSLLLFQPPEQVLDSSIWQKIDEKGSMDLPIVVEIVPGIDAYTAKLHFLRTHITDELAKTMLQAFTDSCGLCIQYPSGELRDQATSDLKGRLVPVIDMVPQIHPDAAILGAGEEVWTSDMLLVRDSFARLSRVGGQRIMQHTSMYQLGLDSLNAAQIAYSLRKNGLRVDAADVLQALTPAAIAKVASSEDDSEAEETQAIDLLSFEATHREALVHAGFLQITDIKSIRPCTPAQHGMLAQSQHMKGQLYVNHILYRLLATTSASQIISAWLSVQRKHQALRTGYWQTDDAAMPYFALVWKANAVTVSASKHVSMTDIEELESMASTAILSELHRPAWRLHIGRHEDGQAMMLSVHHALYDAEGLQYLIADFEAALRGEHIGAEMSTDTLLMAALGPGWLQPRESTEYWQKILKHARQVF
ncbi:NRPS [Recurvomyces mirabilis]|uniref:NRPS n=1 Tax=Recurvomyces mirabilis TaxID=574656 RepID=A0AAE0WXM6_9PEZI|nr:NRPS [Recurvomyces mirabilis]KAK5159018.1 hypothetical protein LTS14_003126 [Recurvomyces mirabilis]